MPALNPDMLVAFDPVDHVYVKGAVPPVTEAESAAFESPLQVTEAVCEMVTPKVG